MRAFEDTPNDTEEAQITFVSALTAFGLAATGSIRYGWSRFENGLKNGFFSTGGESNCYGFS